MTVSDVTSQPEETVLSGIIKDNMILQGRIVIEKDTLIKKDVTVTIKEGSEILVPKADISRTEPIFLMPETEIVVEGTLVIDGTENMPVNIKSQDRLEQWGGIIVNGGTIKAKNFNISDAYNGLIVLNGSAKIKKARFTNNKISIVIEKGDADLEDLVVVSSEVGIINNNPKLSLERVRVENNEEGVLLKNCPETVKDLIVTRNLIGVISPVSCINHNFLSIKNYENKNNLIITNLSSLP